MDTFDDGEMYVDGEATFQYDEADWEEYRRNKIGYVFQDYSLVGHYTVMDNMLCGLLIRGNEKEQSVRIAKEYLEQVGLSGYEYHKASELSSGQKQRLFIARALAKDTGIIVADEPTGNLDEENTLRTMSILKSISKECLVLLVTHEKRIADFFADRIIEIRDGKVYRDEKNDRAGSYERSDDANIYLKELTCKAINEENLDVKIYGEDACKIKLNFAWKDGKLYIQKDMSADIVLEGVESGVHMVDAKRPKLDMEEVEKFSYDLPKLKSKGKAVLTFKEIWRLAIENIRIRRYTV